MMADISEINVVLSARTWNVVGDKVEFEDVEVLDTNVDIMIGPPGRDVLSGVPYCKNSQVCCKGKESR